MARWMGSIAFAAFDSRIGIADRLEHFGLHEGELGELGLDLVRRQLRRRPVEQFVDRRVVA